MTSIINKNLFLAKYLGIIIGWSAVGIDILLILFFAKNENYTDDDIPKLFISMTMLIIVTFPILMLLNRKAVENYYLKQVELYMRILSLEDEYQHVNILFFNKSGGYKIQYATYIIFNKSKMYYYMFRNGVEYGVYSKKYWDVKVTRARITRNRIKATIVFEDDGITNKQKINISKRYNGYILETQFVNNQEAFDIFADIIRDQYEKSNIY